MGVYIEVVGRRRGRRDKEEVVGGDEGKNLKKGRKRRRYASIWR